MAYLDYNSTGIRKTDIQTCAIAINLVLLWMSSLHMIITTQNGGKQLLLRLNKENPAPLEHVWSKHSEVILA